MFEGDSADMLKLMGGRAEGLACADLGTRTPIDVSGNSVKETHWQGLIAYKSRFGKIVFSKYVKAVKYV